MKKKHLAITLSKLSPHPQTNVNLEQYSTHGDLASEWLFKIAESFDFEGSKIVDLGSGNGILGIGAYYAGASEVILVEAAEDAHQVSVANTQTLEYPERFTLYNKKLADVNLDWSDIDLVITNPPWGYQTEKSDRIFVEIGMVNNVPEIHILHSDKAEHIGKLAKKYGYESEALMDGEFILPRTYSHHSKKSSSTGYRAWRLTKSE